ncbi:MAG: AraC family transcriptional regulator [Rhodobacteraceae bacterium]|uniref:AraC family transcriptional regulator n=1 Tax=Celeribacter sp. HF31 TaxID=2721558 RepID=UPI001430045F|nr:AraC family transcriptional regulator [Celeribacter sp. HF31]NIY78158.1 AraC family transcriptional regulator [Celeribacter sp. HF31]NVK46524.1 AraC family transcriptional regulator [Paracoccaceae bacterium]
MARETHGYAAIRSTLLTYVLDRLNARGVATQSLLSKHGISLDMLKDPYAHLSMNEFNSFLESASELSGDQHIGAHIGTEIRAGDLGPMGILLSLSRSIHIGIDRIAKSAAALQSGTEMSFLPNGDEMLMSYQIEDARIWPRRQDAEFSLVGTVQVIRDNFLRRWSPQQVHFEHAPPDDDSFLRQFFRCPILYGQATNRLVMDRAPLMELYRVEDAALVSMLERHIEDLIEATPHNSTLTDAVRTVVTSSLGLRPISVERVAETLGLSPRNLQRKLSDEGTSLRDLLDDIRRDRATTLLSDGDIPVGEVAAALGYADGTAFWRAHKRWSKLTPREVRSGKGYRF